MLKISMIFFLVLIGVIFSFIIYTQAKQTSEYVGAKSDHFDGKLFSNPPPYQIKNFISTFKWMLTRQRKPWPTSIENTAIPSLTPPNKNEIKVTFINHATTLIQTEHLTILTDPIWSERTSPYTWLGPKRVKKPGVAFEKLPKIDVVLISHNHYDHLDLPTLKRLDAKFSPLFLVPLGDDNLLIQHGIHHVKALDWWDKVQLKDAKITFLPTQHWSARGFTDRFKTLWGSYGVMTANHKIYFAGDTGYSANFKLIKLKWGEPDIALLPIGAYQPEWFMHENHMNPYEAVQAHKDLNAKCSIGIHFGTFQLSDEAIDQPLIDLNKALQTNHLTNKDFIILNQGETKIFHFNKK